MDENLIGYLLGTLDPESNRQVEDHLADNPDSAAKLELLRQAIEPLAADKDTIDPPADLSMRTIGLVAQHVVATEGSVATAPSPVADFVRALVQKQPTSPSTPTYPRRASEASPVTYGRRNLIAAGGLAAALLLVGFAAIMTARQTREVLACQNNMRVWNQGLNAFADVHDNRLPQVRPDEDVRAAWKKLQDAGAVPVDAVYVCPGVEHSNMGAPAGPSSSGPPLMDYAYTLGYWDRGQLHGLTRGGENDQFPILADAPERRDRETFPINHRKGQNVLFAGGHVRFCTNPFVGPEVDGKGDDIFFNTSYQPHAGTHRWDCVLGKLNEQP
jgi:prepilin-type processing-associated H-X9-DG protein